MKAKDVLHFYLGRSVDIGQWLPNERGEKEIVAVDVSTEQARIAFWYPSKNNCQASVAYWLPIIDIKLILRPLSSMTEEEAWQLINSNHFFKEHQIQIIQVDENPFIGIIFEVRYSGGGRWWRKLQSLTKDLEAIQIIWLLSKGFDIFNLHESGECLYESDLTKINN